MPDTRIAQVRFTPIAFYDPPLLNNKGCHQPFALRSIIEVETEDGVIGLGESYGNTLILHGLETIASKLCGLDVTDLNGLWARARRLIYEESGTNSETENLLNRIVGAIEVAMWDAFGKTTGHRVVDLLGVG